MEKLATSGMLAGVLDLTTTEVADEIVGGVLSAGPERLDALADSTLPAVISVGALDMVNFGGIETVPEQFKERQLHVHNAQVNHVRTVRAACYARPVTPIIAAWQPPSAARGSISSLWTCR